MNPYGQKQQKCKIGIHGFNNSHEFKVSKTRERTDTNIELNLTPQEDPQITYDDFSEMVVVVPFENSAGEELFRAIYHPLEITCVGVTPEHALGKVYHEFMETFN